jgi:predicted DNA-binding transcriptional regulator AlpA
VIRYLSVSDVAKRTGLSLNTIKAYSQVPGRLPQPDALIGDRVKGWLPETIDRWMARRSTR